MKLSIIVTVVALSAAPAASAAWAQGAAASQTRQTDEQLSGEIATRIANDKSLSADAVKVTVNNGVVRLTGMVGKDADKARAERLATVDGVVRVENNLISREKETNAVTGTAGAVAGKTKDAAGKTADVSKKAAGATKDAVSKTGENITDGWITSRVKTKFMGDDALRASAINVDTNEHVVTLTGSVPSAAARDTAMAMAKEVEGVNRVVDKLKIVK
jgi:hyperosmotically inducible protein